MLQHSLENQTGIAADFLTRCFSPGESIALFLRRENPAGVAQPIVPFDQVIRACELGWPADENCAGTNVYVGADHDLSAEGR
jgi:hypothetical protein